MNLPTTALMWTVTLTMRTGMMTGIPTMTAGRTMEMTMMAMTTIKEEKFPPRPRFGRTAAVSSLCQPKKMKKVFPRPRFFGSGSVI